MSIFIKNIEYKIIKQLSRDYFIKVYHVQKDNKFYFFHPFSVTVFKKVITNIMQSLEHHPRQADIIVYYPTEEYLCYLDHKTDFRLNSGMLIHGAYEKNKQEQILIYRYDG